MALKSVLILCIHPCNLLFVSFELFFGINGADLLDVCTFLAPALLSIRLLITCYSGHRIALLYYCILNDISDAKLFIAL
jgi:hypothetical protein